MVQVPIFRWLISEDTQERVILAVLFLSRGFHGIVWLALGPADDNHVAIVVNKLGKQARPTALPLHEGGRAPINTRRLLKLMNSNTMFLQVSLCNAWGCSSSVLTPALDHVAELHPIKAPDTVSKDTEPSTCKTKTERHDIFSIQMA